MDTKTASAYSQTTTSETDTTAEAEEKEGVLIKGRDFIMLDAPEVIFSPVPHRIVYDVSTDTFTEHKKITRGGVETEVKLKFTLTVEGKGTNSEKVTKLTLPDGSEINFENWSVG